MRSIQIAFAVLRAVTLGACVAAAPLAAQPRAALTPEDTARRWATERALDSAAVVERKVMVPMRDGLRMATDVYRPR
ncbi:MAG: hypothetical protein ACJ8AO_13410, partial [Gemmatimonadaceae bacterium]